MTTKTKSAFLVLGVLIIGVVIGAFASGTLRSSKERHFENMRPRDRFQAFIEGVIKPSEEQKEQFGIIIKKHSQQLAELHQKHQQELFTLYDSVRTELDGVLTKEQLSRLEEHLEKGGGRMVSRRMADLDEALGLSDEQRKQYEQIVRSFKEQMLAGNFEGNWEDRRGMFKERVYQMQQEIEEILTEEQLEKYKQMRHRFAPPPFGRAFKGGPGPKHRRRPMPEEN